jgi:hypothetical protein
MDVVVLLRVGTMTLSSGPGVIALRLSFVGPATGATKSVSLTAVTKFGVPFRIWWKFPRRDLQTREAI